MIEAPPSNIRFYDKEEGGEEGNSSSDESSNDVESLLSDDEKSNYALELPEECSAFQLGDYVKVIVGSFKGYYAVVTGSSYGDELEMNYFEKKEKWWTLKENEWDSREIHRWSAESHKSLYGSQITLVNEWKSRSTFYCLPEIL